MAHDYTYASARVQALASELLSRSQVELLVGAKDNEELFTVLYDTYLASYLKRNTEHDILASLEEHISDTKATLITIVPDPEVLDILWMKYEYHNLKAIVKGLRAGLSDEDILRECYTQSVTAPDQLLAHIHQERLGEYAPELVDTYKRANGAKTPEYIGQVCDIAYFARIQEIAKKSKDEFADKYVRLLIDMYNLKVCVRTHIREVFHKRNAFVTGGACTLPAEFDIPVLAREYARYGGVDRWKHALTEVAEHRNTSVLEKTADDVTSEWVKHEGLAEFCFADIVRYFHAVKNNAQIISVIVKATRAEMPEKSLRQILRNLYV